MDKSIAKGSLAAAPGQAIIGKQEAGSRAGDAGDLFNGYSSRFTGAGALAVGNPRGAVCYPDMLFSKRRFPLAPICFALALAKAEAAITITFNYDGRDTHGVVSGSIILPPVPAAIGAANNLFQYVGSGENELYVHVVGNPSYDTYQGGSTPTLVNLPRRNGEFTGPQSFGFSHDVLYVGGNTAPGGTFAPTGTFTWPGVTLAQAGVSGLTTPVVVYLAPNGEEIRFVTAVPEPGIASLVAGAAALGAVGIRRRSR